MAGGMKSLAKDTAIYGLSSIVGKFVNWCLTPLFTLVLPTGEYGLMTNLYSFTAVIIVILTFGMETGFFRFMNKGEDNPDKVYSTVLSFVGAMCVIFISLCLIFLHPISRLLEYDSYPDFIVIMAIIIAIDAFASIPSAFLRYQKRPLRFAIVKLSGIFTTILFSVFFLLICPGIHDNNPSLISWFYNPGYRVGYVFVANLIGSSVSLLLLLPQLRGFKYSLDKGLMKGMIKYCLPLVILGIAGILNQTVDYILYPYLFEDREYALSQLGIYAACGKLAIIMTMFTQAFRFAYEPFIFARNKEEANDTKAYTEAMKYFVIFSLIIFLGVMFYMDIIKYFIPNPAYYEGLHVVPIIMTGYILFGIYFNLSFWYKMIDKTYFGAVFSVIGCIIIIAINIIFVPQYGYIASAWAAFTGNLVMMLLSYYFERKYRPTPYDIKTIGFYFFLAFILYTISYYVKIPGKWLQVAFNTVLLIIFIGIVLKRDLPLSEIPGLNRLIKNK